MSYASDKLYKGYVRRKMGLIVKRVKVGEIMPYLPCLTDSDREEIGAKRETSGNHIAMQHLLDCLKRRENWPEDFISGLEACEHNAMAEEMRAEYDSLKSQKSSKPPPRSAATVVKAHVQPAPSDPSLTPVAPQTEAAAYPVPAAPAPAPEPPMHPEEPPSPAPHHAPDPPPRPPQSPQATPPPSHQTPPRKASPLPPRERESPAHKNLEENSLTDLQWDHTRREATPPPVEMSEPFLQFGTSDETVHQEATPPLPPETGSLVRGEPVEMSEPALKFGTSDETVHRDAVPSPPEKESPAQEDRKKISEPDPIQVLPNYKDLIPEETDAPSSEISEVNVETTVPCQPEESTVKTLTPELSPPQSPYSTQTDPAEAPDSMSAIMTPEKLPVQDTAPPIEKVTTTVAVPEDVSGAIPTQVTRATGTTLPAVDNTNGPNAALRGEDDDVCMSKPGPLVSIQRSPPTLPVCSGEPYSGGTDRLEFSGSIPPDSEPVAPATAAAARSADPTATEPLPPCQENGVIDRPTSLPHNEPEENYYESSSLASLGEQEVLRHEVHLSEEASIQNLDGQTPSTPGHDVNTYGKPSVQRYDSQPEITIQSPSSVSPESSFLSCDDKTESVTQDEACGPEEPQAQILNGQATNALAKEPDSAPPTSAVTVSIVGAPSAENCHSSASGAVEASVEVKLTGLQDPKQKAPVRNMSKYILTAAGVGACAMLVAWKLKN